LDKIPQPDPVGAGPKELAIKLSAYPSNL